MDAQKALKKLRENLRQARLAFRTATVEARDNAPRRGAPALDH